MLRIISSRNRKQLDALLAAREVMLGDAERVAARILNAVGKYGDRALVELTRRLDRVDLQRIGWTVGKSEIKRAHRKVPPELGGALREAIRNITRVAREQVPSSWQMKTRPGVEVSQLVRPLERVACYVPGGWFALSSTVLMSVIPAQVAGVEEIYLTCPNPAPPVLVAADLLGVKKIYRLGGAQAIAAFALGTKKVPRVDKVVGPGNRYVAAAKRLVSGICGVDFVAGPTELVIIASRGNPRWIAADLVAQAEHDPDAMPILLTSSKRLARAVEREVSRSAEALDSSVAKESLARRGAIIITRSERESLALVNRIAPEHLTLVDDAKKALSGIRSAGSIFLGEYSAVAAGDYASGSNHILPTGAAARVRGGLSAADFVKTISVQRLTREGLAGLRSAITTLARAEGLEAHARSVEVRFESRD